MKELKTINKIWVFILCFAINLLGRFLSMRLSLPILLDSLGVFLCVYFCGPVWGLISSIPTYVVFGIFDATYMPYVIVGILTGLVVVSIFESGYVKGLISMINVGLAAALPNIIASTVIVRLLGEKYIHNIWGGALYEMLIWKGYGSIFSISACFILVEFFDKQITALIAYLIISFIMKGVYVKPAWFVKRAKAKVLVMIVICTVVASILPAQNVNAANHKEEVRFVATLYDSASGMYSTDGNCVVQTSDGYLWIGSSSGLVRYDGVNFERFQDSRTGTVNCLFFDSKDHLWIGSNSKGLVCFEEANSGNPVIYSTKNGLPADSIRALCEDNQGNIYVATSSEVCYIKEDGEVSKYLPDSNAVVSMASKDGVVICVDSKGNLFAYRNGRKIDYYRYEDEELFYNTVAVTSRGVFAGTSENGLVEIKLSERYISLNQSVETPLNDITNIMEDSEGRLWLCAENGFGYLDKKGEFHDETIDGFSSSFSGIMEDFQGNIWIASSKNGLLKLTRSQFSNIFKLANISGSVVNAVANIGGYYYIGKDNGLTVVDGETYQVIYEALSDSLANVKIQCIFEDADGMIWVGTYADNVGLIRYDKENFTFDYYNAYNGLPSGRIRCVSQLGDGSVVVGTNGGLAYIKHGIVDCVIDERNGLENAQIQDVLVLENDECYVCTDGAGVYVISDQKIVRHYGTEDGLGSDVAIKAVECNDGVLVVTSSTIDYIKAGKVTSLPFPCENNYDIKIVGHTVYVVSSTGFYILNINDLLSQEMPKTKVYYLAERLGSNPVRGAQNFVEDDGCLYLCCNNTVLSFHPFDDRSNPTYLAGLEKVVSSEGILHPEADGVTYRIPKEASSVEVTASVRNYNLHYPNVKFYVEEFGNNAEIVSMDKLSPISISNLSKGTLHVVLEVYNGTSGEMTNKMVYVLKKEKKMWEEAYFHFYMLFVFGELLAYGIYLINRVRYNLLRKAELENQQEILERKVNEQTADLLAEKEHTRSVFNQTISALANSVDAKDRYTSGHSKRVAKYAKMIAQRMGKSESELESIYRAGLLHDIGKIRVPAAIINKPGKLTNEEFEVIKLHPVTGFHILKNIADDNNIMLGARYHHERYDGKGYPNGLKGTDIPEVARIIGVADSYDAMTSNRSYRTALPQDYAREEIEKGMGTQFDPEIARIMLEIIDDDKDYEFHEPSMAEHKRILVIDEDMECFNSFAEYLEDEPKYYIVSAADLDEAKTYLAENDVDMIVISNALIDDVAIEVAKDFMKEYENIPVIFATEDKNENHIRMLMRTGMRDFLSKPINSLALKELVHTLINPY